MSTEDLPIQQYKVIADWPQLIFKYHVGDILTKKGIHFSDGFKGIHEDEIIKYPHLFQKLYSVEQKAGSDQYMGQEDWVSVKDRLPKRVDGDYKGYVMVFLRNDRQWGFPTKTGFGKWNRVSPKCHTHWMRCPKPPGVAQ